MLAQPALVSLSETFLPGYAPCPPSSPPPPCNRKKPPYTPHRNTAPPWLPNPLDLAGPALPQPPPHAIQVYAGLCLRIQRLSCLLHAARRLDCLPSYAVAKFAQMGCMAVPFDSDSMTKRRQLLIKPLQHLTQ